MDPGPNEEIVPIIRLTGGSYHALLLHSHAAGAKVVQLLDRLHGVALAGAHTVTMQNVTIQNANMDGTYLTNTFDDSAQHRTYCQNITIQNCKIVRCHRNAISVIDADDVTIANNDFEELTGDPGAPVDVEPDHPEQHGSRIAIRDNVVYRCYRGITLALRLGGPTSQNFRGDSIAGNKITGVFFQQGISVLSQQAGALITRNTITDPGGHGIIIVGSSGVQVTDNIITNLGHCHVIGNCRKSAVAVGIHLIDDTRDSQIVSANENVVSGNTIKDTQRPPTMLYGVDFSSTGRGNTIEKNRVFGFESAREKAVHVSGKAESNKISDN